MKPKCYFGTYLLNSNIILTFVKSLTHGKYKLLISRGVHGSVRVGFVPNPEPTRSHRVERWTTRRRPPVTSGRVGSGSGVQRSGRSKSTWVLPSRSSPEIAKFSPDLAESSLDLRRICATTTGSKQERPPQAQIWMKTSISSPDLRRSSRIFAVLHWIFAESVDFSSDLCDNHGIEAKNTTSSPDLSENFHLIAGSNQKLPNLHRI